MECPDLATPRLRLEALEPRHAPLLFEGLRDDRLYEFIPDRRQPTVEALRERYAQLATRRSPDGTERWWNWAIFCVPEQRYIGFVQATLSAQGVATLGYLLFADTWGKGYGREAVAGLVDHLLAAQVVSEMRATIDPRNVRSTRILESLGFRHVQVRKNVEVNPGCFCDEAEYQRDS